MNPKIRLAIIIGLLASSFAGTAQNTPPAAAPAAAEQTVGTPAAETNAPAVVTAPATAQPGTILPLIVMDEVSLREAIRNLARGAGLNYMLDPKIGYGQIGSDGKPIPEPTVSIRWENVTAEQALLSLLNNYDLQLVEDPKSRIARITRKDPLAPPPLTTKVIQLKYASPTNVIIAVQNTLTDKRSKVVGDIHTSQIVVLATEQEQLDVDLLVERLDTITKQVLIEARLLEMTMNPTTTKGIDWSGTLEAQKFSFGNGVMSGASTTTTPGTPTTLPSGRTTTPESSVTTTLNSIIGSGGGGLGFSTLTGLTPATGFLNADGVKAVLSFINKEADAKTISAPRTVTLDNETAKIEVTRATPIINVSAGTANTSGGSQIQYTNLGVILHVSSRMSANNYVNLKVIPEVSRVFETQHRTVGASAVGTPQTFDVDVYDIRKMETRVMIPSGNTLVLGGLLQDDVRNQNTKVPFLGDIPVIGYAFRSEAKQRQKGNLLIFITPTIVQDEDFVPTKTDFLKTPVPVGDFVSPDWSAYDRAKPLDWKKPVFEDQPIPSAPDSFK